MTANDQLFGWLTTQLAQQSLHHQLLLCSSLSFSICLLISASSSLSFLLSSYLPVMLPTQCIGSGPLSVLV